MREAFPFYLDSCSSLSQGRLDTDHTHLGYVHIMLTLFCSVLHFLPSQLGSKYLLVPVLCSTEVTLNTNSCANKVIVYR